MLLLCPLNTFLTIYLTTDTNYNFTSVLTLQLLLRRASPHGDTWGIADRNIVWFIIMCPSTLGYKVNACVHMLKSKPKKWIQMTTFSYEHRTGRMQSNQGIKVTSCCLKVVGTPMIFLTWCYFYPFIVRALLVEKPFCSCQKQVSCLIGFNMKWNGLQFHSGFWAGQFLTNRNGPTRVISGICKTLKKENTTYKILAETYIVIQIQKINNWKGFQQ